MRTFTASHLPVALLAALPPLVLYAAFSSFFPLTSIGSCNASPQSRSVFLEICGDVEYPGVYAFPPGLTLSQLMERAAPGKQWTLANNSPAPAVLPSGTRISLAAGTSTSVTVAISRTAPCTSLVLGIPVNINETAGAELSVIPGISDGLARRIAQVLSAEGPFRTWDQVRHIDGIGPARIKALQQHCVLGTETKKSPAPF